MTFKKIKGLVAKTMLGAAILFSSPEVAKAEGGDCFIGLYDRWSDKDNDGRKDHNEFQGLRWYNGISPSDGINKLTSKQIGRAEGLNFIMFKCGNHNPGGRAITKFYDSKGNKVLEDITNLSKGKGQYAWLSARTSGIYDEFGPGNYVLKMEVNGRLDSTLNFRLVDDGTSIKPMVFNYWKDLNGDTKVQKSELIGLDKKTFRETEKITWAMNSSWHRGEKQEIRIMGPKGDNLLSFSNEAKHNINFFQFGQPSHEEYVKSQGYGTYAAAFFTDGKHIKTITYEVTESKKIPRDNMEAYEITKDGKKVLRKGLKAPQPAEDLFEEVIEETPTPKRIEGYILDGRFMPYEDKGPGYERKEKPEVYMLNGKIYRVDKK
ncbi:hypothetical protein HOD75_00970 [archaeon]|jgi:hypothetical protein|nr:hypothetical protein [archaeon]MBT4241449.1 hypothetical protein [archaeon]MBT4417680.1 hypothetical protein [archaeon]